MAQRKIDYDRGVLIRAHQATGVEVYMYIDTPGEYLSVHGTPVTTELARQAGYPVDELGKKRELRERMKTAHANIEAELMLQAEEKKVVREKGGFRVVAFGLGRHQVLAPDDTLLTPNPIPEEQAFLLLDQLVPSPVPVEGGTPSEK